MSLLANATTRFFLCAELGITNPAAFSASIANARLAVALPERSSVDGNDCFAASSVIFRLPPSSPGELLCKVDNRDSKCRANCGSLGEIQTPFAGFVLTDVALGKV